MPVVGFLRDVTIDVSDDRVTAFRQGLNEAGFVEGQNVAIEYRSDQTDRLPLLVTDLLRRQVALIVGNTPAALAAKAATTTVPIVFVTGGDPVRVGLVANLNRPVATSLVSASSRWNLRRSSLGSCVSCGREPRALPCSLIPNSPLPSGLSQRSELRLRPLDSKSKFSTSAATAKSRLPLQRSSNAGLVRCSGGTGEFLLSQRDRVVALAARHKIPAMYILREYVAAGGLISYAASTTDANRQAGIYVGRILKGEKPGDLPVMLPTKFELVINVKTAKALGVEIPDRLLALADEVIE